MNHTIVVTAHGQTHDIINEVSSQVSFEEIDKTMQWKTAHYSILNPLHMGMVLAGGPCEDTNAITQYALNAGKLFQINDDLLLFSKEKDDSKNAMDDIKRREEDIIDYPRVAESQSSRREVFKNLAWVTMISIKMILSAVYRYL